MSKLRSCGLEVTSGSSTPRRWRIGPGNSTKLIEAHGLGGDDAILADMMIPEEQVAQVLAAADIACFIYNEDTHSTERRSPLGDGPREAGDCIAHRKVPGIG